MATGALELAGKIAGKDVSSREVVEAHLARVEKVNGHLNAIVRLLTDEALAAADPADAPSPTASCSVRSTVCRAR